MLKNASLLIRSFRKSSTTLLDCGEDYLLMKQAIEELYKGFSTITGVSIDTLSTDNDILLSSGKAIGSAGAAHCLLEMKRTAVFLRGINKAISQKLHEKRDKTIRVLYAGTGPYGTLIIPLLLLYKHHELKVDLLDINPSSLAAIKKVIKALNISSYIDNIYCTDATAINLEKQYDIVISETMQTCLKKEPQVAIMQNLIPQLSEKTIFIPEQISIDAYLTNPKMEQERLFYYEGKKPPFRRIYLGNVFVVDKNNLDIDQKENILEIPDREQGFPILTLITTVKIFQDEVLKERDSSITLPVDFHDLDKQDTREVGFRYIQGVTPGIESHIKEIVFSK